MFKTLQVHCLSSGNTKFHQNQIVIPFGGTTLGLFVGYSKDLIFIKFPSGTIHEYDKADLLKDFHLYITSDEQIQEGDLQEGDYFLAGNVLLRYKNEYSIKFSGKNEKRKIVATTNPDLQAYKWELGAPPSTIKQGLPSIPTDFIEAYVQAQGKITEVVIEYEYANEGYSNEGKPALKLKLNPDGTIIWKLKEEKMYTRQEVEKIAFDSYDYGFDEGLDHMEWSKGARFYEWFNKKYPE
jgi:hypothetical protein